MNKDKVVESVKKNIETLKQDETMQIVFKLKERLESKPVNEWELNSLVDTVFTLCKIMPNLSDLKDFAYIKAEALEEEHKAAVRDSYLEIKAGEEKMTDTMAKSKAEQNCTGIKEKVLVADHEARWLRSIYMDLDRLIGFTQTKVKSISNSEIYSKIER